MADTAVNFLLEKLLQLLSEDIQLITGLEDVFTDLLEQVRILSAFIDDVAKLVWDSNMWKEMDKAIRITVFKTEDFIDKFLVEVRLYQERSKLNKMMAHTHHMSRVRELSKNIKGVIEEMKGIPKGDRQTLPPAENLEREIETEKAPQESKDVSFEDDEVVGFEEEAEILIKRLLEGPEYVDVIPILGMAGVGKTALAKQIVTYPRVCHEFYFNIWIDVGQLNKIQDIFLKILKQFTRNIEEYQEIKDVNKLAKLIRNFLAEGKCLIVLDDVWETHVVDSVMKVFSENNKGHRIMITTRLEYVASYANEDPHYLKFLSSAESFELLKMKVFGKRKYPDELLELGKRIAEKCGGLPLAIVVIAGALISRSNKSDWMLVEKNVMGHLIREDYSSLCSNSVWMSYDSLSQEMQSCFLYCGAFPRGYDIPAWKLIRLWIAEGLIKSNPAYTFEEAAQYYLNGLVSRSLVMVKSKKIDGQIKTCCVQNLLHEFCKMEARRKWFFQEISSADQNVSIHDPSTFRRLCIQSSALQDFLSTTPFAEHVRSCYCFSARQIELPPSHIQSLHKAFPLIRVLDTESLKFLFSKAFYHLFHLRYIAISGDFMAIPKAFGNFWNIQTLILTTSATILEIKADIWNLLRLRHIHTNVPAKLPSPTTSAVKSVLQTLSLVAPESLTKDMLAKVCYLTKLSIQGPMMGFLETNKGGWHNLEELRWLETLKLVNDAVDPNKSLHFPPFFEFLHTLTKLTLSKTRFDWTEAVRLGQLECLEVLKLKEHAFCGDSWRPEIGGFSQLQILWIEKAELQTWEASNLHFPSLRRLVLISCENLDAVPFGLADIPHFKEMRLENTGKAVQSAREIERTKLESIKFKLTIFPLDTDC